jgi:gamma-glutamylaminecyclotransferase
MYTHWFDMYDNVDSAYTGTYQVFVYGSLKGGCGNNHILRNSEFLGSFTTVDKRFYMISLKAFPGVLESGSGQIKGELYRVDAKVMARLDMLEGNGSFYTRQEIEVYRFDENDNLIVEQAWMYVLDSHSLYAVPEEYVEVISTVDGIFNWSKDKKVELTCKIDDSEGTYVIT